MFTIRKATSQIFRTERYDSRSVIQLVPDAYFNRGYDPENPMEWVTARVEGEMNPPANNRVTLSKYLAYSGGKIRWVDGDPSTHKRSWKAVHQVDTVLTEIFILDEESIALNGRNVRVKYLYRLLPTRVSEASNIPEAGTWVVNDVLITSGDIVLGVEWDDQGEARAIALEGDIYVTPHPYVVSNIRTPEQELFLDRVGINQGESSSDRCVPSRYLVILNVLGLVPYYLPGDDEAILVAALLSATYDRCEPKLGYAGLMAALASRLFKNLFGEGTTRENSSIL